MRPTAVQAIWLKQTVPSARKQMLIGAVARRLIRFSSGTLTVEYQGCTSLMMILDLPFLDTPLSTHSDLHGGWGYNANVIASIATVTSSSVAICMNKTKILCG